MRSGWAGGNAKHRPPFALVLFLDIDWDETNKQHQLKCQLLTADGDPVVVPGPHGPQRILLKPPPRRAALLAQSTAPRFACRSPSTFLREFPWNQESTSGAWRSKVTSGPRRSKHLSWPAGPPAGVMRVGLIAEILTATTTFTILTHPIAAVGTCCC